MKPLVTATLSLAATLAPPAVSAEDALPLPLPSVLEVMERVITPLSDTLWGVDDPRTDAEWEALENAALTMTALAAFLDSGGSGPSDADWAAEPAWNAFNARMAAASVAARAAIVERDLDALFEAGDALYFACEACHEQFNPAVTDP